jgi:hypothetical protein
MGGGDLHTDEYHVLYYSPTSTRAKKQSRPLVVGLSPTRYGFDPRPVRVGFVVEPTIPLRTWISPYRNKFHQACKLIFIHVTSTLNSISFHRRHCSPFGSRLPSQDASILLNLLLVSPILAFLGSVTFPSKRRPPILFLVFQLVLYYEISH